MGDAAAYQESLRRAVAEAVYDAEGNHYINPRMLQGNPLVKLLWRCISTSARMQFKSWFDKNLNRKVQREKVRGWWELDNKIRYLKVDSRRTLAVCFRGATSVFKRFSDIGQRFVSHSC